MKKILMFAAFSEGAFGAILLASPVIIVRLLFGDEIAGAGVVTSRLAGLCLIALGVACWPDRSSLRAYYGMLSWSMLAMLYLIVVGIGGQAGVFLWPAVVVHASIASLLIWAHRHSEKQTLPKEE